jgi:hypothetical protein
VLEPVSRTPSASRSPSRAVVVIAAALVQLAGAGCLVLGLAALPMAHDLHESHDLLAGWIGGAVVALVCGGLAYRARIIPLLVAAATTAALGFVLPRGDSAVGVLAHLLPHDDLPERAVMVASIAMFAIAASCIAVLPWAVAYRTWLRESTQPARTLLGFTAAVPPPAGYPTAPRHRRTWLVVAVGSTVVGATIGAAVIEIYGGRGHAAQAASVPPEPVATSVQATPAVHADAPPTGAPSPQRLAAALDHALAHPTELAALLDPDAFAFGPDPAGVAALMPATVTIDAHTTAMATDGSLGWFAQDLTDRHVGSPLVGSPVVSISAIVHEVDGRWTIAALAITGATGLPARPAQLADLAGPSPTAHELVDAVGAGALLATNPSKRHAPGAVTVLEAARLLTPRLGWTATNIDLRRDGGVDHLRVLAAWVHDGAGWHVAFAQWVR